MNFYFKLILISLVTILFFTSCSVDQFLDIFTLKSVRAVENGSYNEDLDELKLKAKGFEDEIEEKIEAGDRLADIYESLAALYLIRKNYELSITFFEKAIAMGNISDEMHRRLGTAYANRARELQRSNDFDKALYHYTIATEKKSDNYNAHYGRALILFYYKNQKDEAIDVIRFIVKAKSDYYEARFAYGRMLYELGSRDKSLVIYQALLEDLQKDPDTAKNQRDDALANISRLTRELASQGGVDGEE